MRRQVKPFVTEYRGAPRRTKDVGSESETPRHRAYDEAQRFFHSEPGPAEPEMPGPVSLAPQRPEDSQPDFGDDSYDAALRAADALFSAPAKPVFREPSPEPVSAQPWPDRGDAPREERAAPPLFDDGGPEKIANSPPRRILQAIEPPAEDRFAALEAERAPKRRGRKPGSKNKPKIAVGDDWPRAVAAPTEASAPKLPARKAEAHPAALQPVPNRTLFANDDLAADADDEGLDRDLQSDEAPGTPSKPRNDRFMRKRDGLRPGERWKRRLPKAAW